MKRNAILIETRRIFRWTFLAGNIDAQVEHERNHGQIHKKDRDVKQRYSMCQPHDLIGKIDSA